MQDQSRFLTIPAEGRDAQALRIHYRICRQKRRSPMLVFIHGAGGDLNAWKALRKDLHRRRVSTLAIDLRGHGRSDKPMRSVSYSLDCFAADVHAVLVKERIKDPIIVGHCFGGMVSIYFHKLYPSHAKGYVFIDTSYQAPQQLRRMVKEYPNATRTLHSMLERMPSMVKPRQREDYERFKHTGDWDIRRITSDIAHTSLRSWIFTYSTLAHFDGTHTLLHMKQPTLVLQGEDDSVFDIKVARTIESLLPNGSLKVIPGYNHIIILNNPPLLEEEIVEFASRISGIKLPHALPPQAPERKKVPAGMRKSIRVAMGKRLTGMRERAAAVQSMISARVGLYLPSKKDLAVPWQRRKNL